MEIKDKAVAPNQNRYTTTLVLSQQHCCPAGTYWVAANSACEKPIANCKVYLDDNTQTCKECETNFTLINNNKNCCSEYGFYNFATLKCVDQSSPSAVYSNCIDWNEQTLLCQKCEANFYISNSPDTFNTQCC